MMTETNIHIAQRTSQGVKSINEDSVNYCFPSDAHQLIHKGICALVADGVSTAEAGKQASELSVKQFVEDYYKTPDTWTVEHAGKQILSAINLKLYRLSDAYRVEGKGYLCTFSGVVIKSRTAHVFHVGDSRVYLYRKGELKQLTQDHSVFISKSQAVLSRAVGMDTQIHIDYFSLSIEPSDIFLCTSDGIHDFLVHDEIKNILASDDTADNKSQTLCDLALNKKSDDNISAVVVDIETLQQENIDDFNARLTRLPFPPQLEPGMKIDGFQVIREIYASSRSQLYEVNDMASGKAMVMKTPSINFEEDNHYIDRFIQEEWVGKRIRSPYVVDVVAINREKHFLYYLLELVDGTTLSQWMKENPTAGPTTSMNIIEQIAQGLRAFHQNDSVHQDLRPSNIMINKDNKIKIVDYGSVYVAGIAEMFSPIQHDGALGTASYADPIYLQGRNPGVQGDLYSLGTIAYELFTHRLPYGDSIEECSNPLYYDRLRYKPANKYNSIIPIWFDRALEKSVKFELQERYRTIRDFIKDLKQPNPEFLRDDPKVEYTKSPLLFWQMMSVFWVVMLFLMVIMFSR
ncbi:protein kinase domain-containing protein [Pseudomonas sp. HK3]